MDGLVSVIRWGNRLKEVKQFLGGHIAGKWQSCDLCPVYLIPELMLSSHHHLSSLEGEDQRDNFLEILEAPHLGRWKREMRLYF